MLPKIKPCGACGYHTSRLTQETWSGVINDEYVDIPSIYYSCDDCGSELSGIMEEKAVNEFIIQLPQYNQPKKILPKCTSCNDGFMHKCTYNWDCDTDDQEVLFREKNELPWYHSECYNCGHVTLDDQQILLNEQSMTKFLEKQNGR